MTGNMGEMLAKIVADAIQPVLRDLHMLKSAFSRMVKEGAVEEIDAEKGYRAKLGEGTDGQPYLSGWMPFPESSKSSVPLKKGQPVVLLCPGGDVRQALMLRTGYSDALPSPNSDMEANVFEDAGVKVTIADGKLTAVIGGMTAEFSGTGLNLVAGGVTFAFTGAGFTQTGGQQVHDGKDVGKTSTHTGVTVGGGTTGPVA
jgi:hypothetical protein